MFNYSLQTCKQTLQFLFLFIPGYLEWTQNTHNEFTICSKNTIFNKGLAKLDIMNNANARGM